MPSLTIAALPPVIFLIGGLGAGKTELACNLARQQAELHGPGRVHLLDVDIVNPYYRVRKLEKTLTAAGVTVVIPGERTRDSDIPALPVGIWGALERDDVRVVVDVGGDVVGLRPLARLRELANRRQAAVYFVANPLRPGTRTVDEMTNLYKVLSEYCTLEPTAVVANPHLQDETTPEVLAHGLAAVEAFAARVQRPLAFVAVDETLAPRVCQGAISDTRQVLAIHRYWRTAWTIGNEEATTSCPNG